MVSLKPTTSSESQRTELPCYQVGCSNPGEEEAKYLVLVFSDVHGPDTGNHKAFCDALQEKLGESWAVWMPDLFRGHPMAPDVGHKYFWVDWICRLSILWAEKTRMSVPAVREDLEHVIQPNISASVTSIGMAGFCYGAWVIGRSLGWSNHSHQGDKPFFPTLNAGVLIHPSWRPEAATVGGGLTKQEMAKATKTKPILLLPGKQDVDFHATSALSQQLAQQRNLNVNDIVVDFTHMDHGWVSRADCSQDKALQEAQEQATQQTADFFKKHLK